ncbi:glycoside hydrolase family 127 protein [Jiangella ureilytica]|uniref:Glycoside hydrolase family 127 protein n=1 Tax=Jiangella ureilytica TaxID=2530374 RepID=A0A4R4R9S0_9ACTN|nr:beta-L-arabinofuranosidase domain-containing protein [Jiangella ureilytica]TDC45858.1 glycoside hydrolase family 127 protein [Jiangella ureilytica]
MSEPTPAGPVAPSAAAAVRLRPLGVGQVRITGGLAGEWQRRTREVTVPTAVALVESTGTLRNLEIAAGEAEGEFQGMHFADSDVAKVLEAVAWQLAAHGPDDLHRTIDHLTGVLERAQRPDGYLNSWIQLTAPDGRYAGLVSSHELYCYGHLIQAAVALDRATGDARLLAVARRVADHVVAEFLRGGRRDLDGHPEIETALVELYRHTAERSYLDQASEFVERRGHGHAGQSDRGSVYLVDHEPVRTATTLNGHAVRALYLEAGVVDVAVETGDEELLTASIRRWEDTVAHKTALTGGHGSRHLFEAFGDRDELPPDQSYNETCAAVASIHWSWRLLLATGESRFADLVERTLYNTVAASTSVDGDRFFYVNPLQRRPDSTPPPKGGRRRPWFRCACCPPNGARLIGSLGHYAATTSGDGVQLHLFVPAVIDTGDGVRLTVATEYPDDGRIRVTVDRTPAEPWRLELRLPAWSAPGRTALTVAGTPAGVGPDERGYLIVDRAWRPGDVVELDLDVAPRLTYPHHRLDALRGTVAVERGPLVYCFEQVDQPAGVTLDDLALTAGATLTTHRESGLGLPGPVMVVDAAADVLAAPPRTGLPYGATHAAAPAVRARVTARAVPYHLWDNRDDGAMRVWLPRSPRRP